MDLSAQAIRSALTTQRLGHPTLYFPTIGSTNDVAHEHAAAGAAEGLLVVADEQTAGRGRLGRGWWAPPGTSLLMSLLLRPRIPARQAGQLTMCLGLAAAEAVEVISGLRPALKWPNDLLLDGRKLAGMLSELRLDGDRLTYAVLGLGLNVNQSFEGQLARTATSLAMALGHPLDRLPLLAAILAHCEAWYARLLGGESPHEAWAARLDTIGRLVTIRTLSGTLDGLAVSVTPEGALLLKLDDGELREIWSGDVVAVRPTGDLHSRDNRG